MNHFLEQKNSLFSRKKTYIFDFFEIFWTQKDHFFLTFCHFFTIFLIFFDSFGIKSDLLSCPNREFQSILWSLQYQEQSFIVSRHNPELCLKICSDCNYFSEISTMPFQQHDVVEDSLTIFISYIQRLQHTVPTTNPL